MKRRKSKMANKKADFKLDDMKEINKQANVKSCWFDDKEGLFHCLLFDDTEWTSPTGSAQDKWTRIKTSDFVKADSGKLQWSLLPFEELKDVVRVLMLGAKKYTPDNWKKCDDVTRYKDALMRHVISYVSGDTTDGESGLSHLAHAVCNCLFLMYFDNTKKEK
jgi:hypothetical protein